MYRIIGHIIKRFRKIADFGLDQCKGFGKRAAHLHPICMGVLLGLELLIQLKEVLQFSSSAQLFFRFRDYTDYTLLALFNNDRYGTGSSLLRGSKTVVFHDERIH